jgi:myo-inositol-1(or 4)-monophosphatase
MHPMMNVAIKAARSAGTVINRAALNIERLQIARKQQNDYVTEVDRMAESTVIEVLREAYPQHNFLAEELGYIRADGEQLGAMSWEDAIRQDDSDQVPLCLGD